MNRIDQIFADLRARHARAIMPYVTAGDPDLETTAQMLHAMQRAGASIVELGIPFSDPIADGPVIQASMTHALSKGVRPGAILDMVARERSRLSIGLVAMVSYSIVHKIGPKAYLKNAKDAGIDGVIFPDLPVEEADEALAAAKDANVIFSMLIAPTTPIERAERIARACTGFIYVLARAGITGERSELPLDLGARIERLKQVTNLPITVGFGVSTAQQVRQVVQVADAAIVGSAIMRRVADHRAQGNAKVVSEVESFVADLATGLVG